VPFFEAGTEVEREHSSDRSPSSIAAAKVNGHDHCDHRTCVKTVRSTAQYIQSYKTVYDEPTGYISYFL
jgi:hypothetical protein